MPPKRKRASKSITKGTMRLRGNLKLKYAAAVYSVQAANAKLETIQASIKHRAETDEHFAEALRLMSQEQSLKTDVSKALGQLHVVAKNVCEKFSITPDDFKNYVVDTESGQITNAPLDLKGS